jgi:hypothetical protein
VESFGSRREEEITHPECIILGDELQTDVNQKEDEKIAGTNDCVREGTRSNIKNTTNGRRFTVIGLIAASGDPIMHIVIFAAKELSYEQWMGHDIWTEFHGERSFGENSGPTCYLGGNDVPALITCSPKGSITSEILREAFQLLDSLGMYEHIPAGGPIRFALLDAHKADLSKCCFLGM